MLIDHFPSGMLRQVVRGSVLTIYGLGRDGRFKSLDFIDELDARVKATYLAHMQIFADSQRLRSKFGHPMDPNKPPGKAAKGLYGFKDNSSQTRLLAFQSKVGWVLSHGFGEKKEDEFPPIEITRADAERDWFRPYEEVAVLAEEKAKAAAHTGGKR